MAAVVRLPCGAALGAVTAGGATALALVAAIPTLLSGGIVVMALLRAGGEQTDDPAIPLAAALAVLAAGLRLFAWLRAVGHAVRRATTGARWLGHLGSWYAAAAALVLLCAPGIPLVARIAIGLGLAAAASVALDVLPRASVAARLPVLVGVHLLVATVALLSWRDDAVVVWSGAAIVAVTVVMIVYD